MSYLMSFNLTDQEYAALNAAASRAGIPVEEVLHDALASFISVSPPDPPVHHQL